MNRTKIVVGLILLVLLWAGNIYFFERNQLNEPLFLKHYYDLTLTGDHLQFDLYYLVNRQDDAKTATLRMEDNSFFFQTTEDVKYRGQYWTLKHITVHLSKDQIRQTASDRIIIQNIRVQFPRQQEKKIQIGEIHVRLGDSNSNILFPRMTGTASDGKMSKSLAAFDLKQPSKVIGFQIPEMGQIKNQVKLKVNQTEWTNQPLPVSAANDIQVEYLLPKQSINMYSLDAQVLFEKADGRKEIGKFRISSDPPYTEQQLSAIVQTGRN